MSVDIKSIVRLVDDFEDKDYKTRNSCPGTVFGKQLVPVAVQRERRIIGKGRIKNWIFVLQGTRELWYKKSYCNAGVVAMGFSLNTMQPDNKSLPMEVYAEIFLDPDHLVNGVNSAIWRKRNDFESIITVHND